VVAASAIALILILAACGKSDTNADSDEDAIRISSFDFTESVVLAELYAQAMELADIDVVRKTKLGSREVVEPAIEQGVIDMVPEYIGSALTFLDGTADRASTDATVAYGALRDAFASRGVTTLQMSQASNNNAFAVTAPTASRLSLKTTSDLQPHARSMSFGGPAECAERQFCLLGLQNVYGLEFREFKHLDAAGPQTIGALQGSEVDVALLFTTTPQIDTEHFVVLEDDRKLQPAENVVPIVRTDVLNRHGDRLTNAINRISAQLTTRDLRDLNTAVDVTGTSIHDAASNWLASHQYLTVNAGSSGGAEPRHDEFLLQNTYVATPTKIGRTNVKNRNMSTAATTCS